MAQTINCGPKGQKGRDARRGARCRLNDERSTISARQSARNVLCHKTQNAGVFAHVHPARSVALDGPLQSRGEGIVPCDMVHAEARRRIAMIIAAREAAIELVRGTLPRPLLFDRQLTLSKIAIAFLVVRP